MEEVWLLELTDAIVRTLQDRWNVDVPPNAMTPLLITSDTGSTSDLIAWLASANVSFLTSKQEPRPPYSWPAPEVIAPTSTATNWTVLWLLDAGERKINVIKAVRAATNLGLKESKDLVDNVPSPIGPLETSAAMIARRDLQDAGALVDIDDDVENDDLQGARVVLRPQLLPSGYPHVRRILKRSGALAARQRRITRETVIFDVVSLHIAVSIVDQLGEAGVDCRYDLIARRTNRD